MLTTEANPPAGETANRPGPEVPKITVERFQTVVRWVANQPGVPIGVKIALEAAAWLVEVDAFRELEEKFMLDGGYDSSLLDHRVMLSGLIASGEGIVRAGRKSGMATPPVNFTLEDLEATLNSLHRTFRCEHGPKNSQKTNELIAQLFDGPKPRD